MSSTYEIGDLVALDFTVKVGTTLTDATVTLTITLPDGTTTSPAPTHVSAGTYHYDLLATQNGAHSFRWAATGAAVAAQSGSFVIGGIVSLAEVKQQLNLTSTAQDAELQDYIDSVTAAVEHYCGAIMPNTVSEWHDPFGSVLMLRSGRIASVTSVTEYRGTAAYVYSQIPDPTGAGSYTVLVDPSLNGKLTRIGPGGFDFPFTGRVLVVYQAGLAAVPTAVNLAARIIVQHLWESQRGPKALPLQGGDTVDLPGFPYAIPNGAKELLEPLRRTSGIA